MAKTNWLEILDWNKDQLEDIRYLAFSYVKEGQYDIALKMFHALIILEPDNAYDLQTLGSIYLEKGNSLEALDYIDRSLKIESSHLPTLLNRAKALLSLGYKKQGLTQAIALEKCPSKIISSRAQALISSYK